MSRYGIDKVEPEAEEVARNYTYTRMVNRVQTRGSTLSVPEDIRMIQEAAKQSETYQKMIKAVKGDWDIKDPLVQEVNNKAEYSVDDSQGEELLYRGNLLVPPPEIRKKLLCLAHDAHQSENSMWLTCRGIWYWPGLKQELENYYKSCRVCQENKKTQCRSAVKENTELYAYSANDYWGIDCCVFQGQDYLVARDRTSSFIMAQEISSQSSRNITKVLEMWISKVGMPIVIRCDNATAFHSKEFKDWAAQMFIKVVYSSPYNSESNGAAEVAVREVKRILETKTKKGLQRGLLQLNTSTKQNMSGSPADLFLGRPVKGLLPGQTFKIVDRKELLEQRRMIQEKLQMKRRNSPRGLLEVGDHVRIQDNITKKWTRKGVVVQKVVDVSSFEVSSEGNILHRNRKFLQRIDNEED